MKYCCILHRRAIVMCSLHFQGAAVNMKYIRLEIDQSVAGPLDNNLVGIDAVSMTGTGDCSMTCAGP